MLQPCHSKPELPFNQVSFPRDIEQVLRICRYHLGYPRFHDESEILAEYIQTAPFTEFNFRENYHRRTASVVAASKFYEAGWATRLLNIQALVKPLVPVAEHSVVFVTHPDTQQKHFIDLSFSAFAAETIYYPKLKTYMSVNGFLRDHRGRAGGDLADALSESGHVPLTHKNLMLYVQALCGGQVPPEQNAAQLMRAIHQAPIWAQPLWSSVDDKPCSHAHLKPVIK